MFLEKDIDEFLNEEKYSFLKLIYNILLFTFFPLLILYYFRYNYLKLEYYFVTSVFILAILLLLIFGRIWLLKKHLLICGLCLGFIFLLISIFYITIKGFSSSFPMLAILMSFSILLITVNDKYAFVSVLVFITGVITEGIFKSYDYSKIQKYESDMWFVLLNYWFLFLLFFVLYQSCTIMKMCHQENINYLKRYKYLANLEYKHRLMGKVLKCVVHDMATPLSVISGSIRLLGNKEINKKEMACIKSSSLESIVYLESILEKSFNLVKEDKNKNLFNPNICIKKVLIMVNNMIRDNNILIEEDFVGSIRIKGSSLSFSRIFLNILINSMEELALIYRKEKVIKIISKVKDNKYILSIKDNGRGMERKTLHRIGDDEFTLKDSNHSGLGLFFVFDIIANDFKGSVIVNTKEKKYTEIIVEIPL